MYKSSSHSNRLWLAVRLPQFVFQALDLPFTHDTRSLVVEKKQVIWASPGAVADGVCLGMAASTAEVLTQSLAYHRNSVAEKNCLKKLLDWAYKFTPHIQVYESPRIAQAGLLLEVSSCLNLFNGLVPLVTELKKGLQEQSWQFVIGQAHTAYAAWLLSFFDYPLIDDKNPDASANIFIDRLNLIPIQLLHDYPQVVDALDKTGFKTLGDISRQIKAQSISGIKKRWGQEFTSMLVELFGLDDNFQQVSLFSKPVNYYQLDEYFQEKIQFDYPIANTDQLESPIENLLQKLSRYLLKRQLATQDVEWILSDIYHRHESLIIYADVAQTHWKLFFDLTLIQLESRESGFEVDTISLIARNLLPAQKQTESLNFQQQDKSSAKQNLTITMAKLKARMGDKSMRKLSYRDSHIPEVRNQLVGVNKSSQQSLPDIHQYGLRPAWLFKQPVPINDSGGLFWRGRLELLVGPERIQGNWWNKPTARDYFLARRQDDLRLWIFWDLHQHAWFVHGVFQ